MKKIVLIITLIIAANIAKAQYPNPIVKRLSNQEVAECRTPAAVAYNFIESILCRDFERMLSQTDTKFATSIIRWINEDNLTHDLFFVKLFSAQGGEKLNILGWMPALIRNYEVAIAYVQDEWYYMDDDGSMRFHFDQVVKDGMIYIPGEYAPRAGINQKKVYVTCSPTSEVNYTGFQDITRYGDTNVKVLLEQVSGTWKVIGFK